MAKRTEGAFAVQRRTGGRHLTAGIRRYLQHTRGYEVGFLTAEEIKKQV